MPPSLEESEQVDLFRVKRSSENNNRTSALLKLRTKNFVIEDEIEHISEVSPNKEDRDIFEKDFGLLNPYYT